LQKLFKEHLVKLQKERGLKYHGKETSFNWKGTQKSR
jgi:hypothetical protein